MKPDLSGVGGKDRMRYGPGVTEHPVTPRTTRPGASATALRAYEAVRASIATGDYTAGMWLPEPMVAATLGLSRTPVREAFRMLAAEGSIELIHNRGARVTRWTAADIDEVYRLRALLEGHGAALAARNASRRQVTQIQALQADYEASMQRADASPRVSAQCNNDFHAAILEASGSPRLATLLDVISSAPLVTQALQRYTEDDRARSVVQHRDIITAIQHHDDALAEAAMRSHILAARYTALRLADAAETAAEMAED
jgi:DNA-binding GntR family transcriptional regulator